MLLTLHEAGRLLRVCPRTIKRHIDTGQLKAFKVGRSWRVPADQFQDFFDVDTLRNVVATAARRMQL